MAPHATVMLAFHLVAQEVPFVPTAITITRFFALIDELRSHGWNLASGDRIGANTLQVSFDDGYAALVPVCQQLLDDYGHAPIIYMPTGLIGKTNEWDFPGRLYPLDHLNERQITSLANRSVQFGSHGITHSALTMMDPGKLSQELTESKECLEQVTGKPVRSISYPFGRFDQVVVHAAGESGYQEGVTMKLPAASDTPLTTGRVPVYSFESCSTLLRKLRSGPWQPVERCKAQIIGMLNAGTVLMQQLTR